MNPKKKRRIERMQEREYAKARGDYQPMQVWNDLRKEWMKPSVDQ